MARNCNCSGPCGPQDDGVTRREFITLAGLGAAGAMLPLSGSAQAGTPPPANAELTAWLRDLRQPGGERVYLSQTHTDARFPLGGIGTGNIEIGPDGQLLNWQLFNTLRDGYVPLFFAVHVGGTTRILQTNGGDGLPRIAQIEMTGQYPEASLRYRDPALPIDLSMTAFTPFAPLDTTLSSQPLICFVFKAHNPTQQVQTMSLAALMQNPIGYDAMGAGLSHTNGNHPDVGANVNTVSREGGATTLAMSAIPGPLPTVSRPLHIYTNVGADNLNAYHGERPEQLAIDDVQRLPDAAQLPTGLDNTVIWLEEAPRDFSEQVLLRMKDAVTAGATLIFSGKTLPIVQSYREALLQTGNHAKPAADLVYDDFEGGYAHWTVEGTAFGTGPVTGPLPSQQTVSGYGGKCLVNSYAGGDMPTGKLTSRDFKIERDFIHFLVGGGDHPGTQIRLVIDGKVVRATSGQNSEALLPKQWDMHEFRGQTAHIEIVDEETGAWGHILVDQIVFSDLPFSVSGLDILRVLLANLPDTLPKQWVNPVGKGKVIVVSDAIMSPTAASLRESRQKAYARVSALMGADYATSTGAIGTAPGYGTVALATLGGDPTARASFDHWQEVITQFGAQGRLAPLSEAAPNAPTLLGQTTSGALASTVEIAPGATVEVPFLLAWHYPNKYNQSGVLMGNHYAQEWPDATAVVRHAASAFPAMQEKTEAFRRTFYDSTLPVWMLDCITSQISTIRQIGVVFRIANGDIYGWEGANGCCEPTCTHVWGYEQTLSRVFPDLEREMRRIDLEHQQQPSGGINNRTDIPSPPHPSGEGPFSDGHCSSILKAYREVLNSFDPALLHRYWPHVKLAVDYLIARDAAGSGGKPSGTLNDGQANTYDNTIHGVNSFIGSYYLAALRAGEEMAKSAGETETAQRFRTVFEAGRTNLDAQCWNGEYYQQNLPDYMNRGGEYGRGCLADQLIGQWWAHQLGLGYLLPPEHVKTALRSLYRYNWRADFTTFQHNWRHFAGGNDKGLLICTWPKGGRPANTIPYVDEVWTGVEYQVAAHMLYEGLIDEGFAVVKGARERYDGIPRSPIPRSPWNEIECGGHYARAMSSWSLLLALSGFGYDGLTQTLRFQPLNTAADGKQGHFKSFFSGPEGWGSLSQTQHGQSRLHEITVISGQIAIIHLELASASQAVKAKVMLGHTAVPARLTQTKSGVRLTLTHSVQVKPDSPLTVELV